MAWYDKLMFWRETPVSQSGTNEYEIDGCFTLPDANLDDLADTPVGGPEDALKPEDYPAPES